MDVTARGTLTDSTILGGTIPALDFDGSLVRDTAHVKATGSFAGFDPGGGERPHGDAGHGRRHARRRRDRRQRLERRDARQRPGGREGDARAIDHRRPGHHAGERRRHVSRLDRRDSRLRDRRPRRQRPGERDAGAERHRAVEPEDPRGLAQPRGDRQAVQPADRRHRQSGRDGHRQPARAAGGRQRDRQRRQVRRQRRADDLERLHGQGAGPRRRERARRRRTRTRPSSPSAARTSTSSTRRPPTSRSASTSTSPRSSRSGRSARPARWCCTRIIRKCTCRRSASTTQGQTWQMAPGSEATIKYGSDSVTVTNLTLMSGDQQISADGTFGRPGDALEREAGQRRSGQRRRVAAAAAAVHRPRQRHQARLPARRTRRR